MEACSHPILRKRKLRILLLFKSRKYQECPKSIPEITDCRIQARAQSLSGFSLWIMETANCKEL